VTIEGGAGAAAGSGDAAANSTAEGWRLLAPGGASLDCKALTTATATAEEIGSNSVDSSTGNTRCRLLARRRRLDSAVAGAAGDRREIGELQARITAVERERVTEGERLSERESRE
jgi:hypothetical protein